MAAAAPYARVMEDMLKGREFATQLQGLLWDSPEAGRLVDQILHAISRTIDTARSAAAAGSEEGSEVQSEVTGGGKRKAAAGAGGGDRRGACRRRAQQSSVVTKTMKNIEDGHAWRKYGQKDIQNSKHPKAYFRCTHKYDQHCLAQRQVQRCDDDPDVYTVTYIGEHTCRDPADAVVGPLAVHAAAMADDGLHAGSRLICFAPSASAATTSTTTTTTMVAGQQKADHKDAVLPVPAGLRPLRVEGGADQELEEVLSSLTPPGSTAAQRNAAATPGPDQGDVTSGLQQQHFYDDGVDMVTLMYEYDDGTFFDLEDLIRLDQGRY